MGWRCGSLAEQELGVKSRKLLMDERFGGRRPFCIWTRQAAPATDCCVVEWVHATGAAEAPWKGDAMDLWVIRPKEQASRTHNKARSGKKRPGQATLPKGAGKCHNTQKKVHKMPKHAKTRASSLDHGSRNGRASLAQ